MLLRKAASIHPRRAVGHWLYGVAYRTALRAREASARRCAKERQAGLSRREPARESDADWRPLLDEELSRLPEKYRAPIVLCDLQGRTHKEAARELGWPQGTLSGRLWRGRELLARRLTRRGLTLSATVLTLACAEDVAFASVAAPLARATAKVAQGFIAGGNAAAVEVSARVAGLTQGVLRAMWMTKVRMAGAVLLAAGLGVGAVRYGGGAPAQLPSDKKATTTTPAEKHLFPVRKPDEPPESPVPSTEHLIQYLNRNAQRVPALRCDVTLDCREGGMAIGLGGSLACERPVGVHLIAKVLGQPAIELGSKKGERWFWLSKEEVGTRRNWPEVYRPEWLLDLLGMAEYGPAKNFSVQAHKSYIDLVEPIYTSQVRPLRKIIRFHRDERQEPQSQVAAILLKDGEDKVLVQADIKSVHLDRQTGARLTQKAVVAFPRERLEVRLEFNNFRTDALPPDRSARIFSPSRAPVPKAAAAGAAIQLDLTNDHIELRCREETFKLSGRPDSVLALRTLQDQLRLWTDKDKRAVLCVACPASAEYAALKAVLDVCRQAGIRQIEVRTVENKKDKQESK